jgi:hypothetical protein
VLYWAYPPNSFRRRGERLTMVVVVGGCFVFQKNLKKRTIPTFIFYGAIVFDFRPNANRG